MLAINSTSLQKTIETSPQTRTAAQKASSLKSLYKWPLIFNFFCVPHYSSHIVVNIEANDDAKQEAQDESRDTAVRECDEENEHYQRRNDQECDAREKFACMSHSAWFRRRCTGDRVRTR
jgi:hypothetical protein